MSAKQTINDKLQGSVATYIRCGGLLNNQIKEDLLPSVRVNFFKSVNIWQSYKQERGCSAGNAVTIFRRTNVWWITTWCEEDAQEIFRHCSRKRRTVLFVQRVCTQTK